MIRKVHEVSYYTIGYFAVVPFNGRVGVNRARSQRCSSATRTFTRKQIVYLIESSIITLRVFPFSSSINIVEVSYLSSTAILLSVLCSYQISTTV